MNSFRTINDDFSSLSAGNCPNAKIAGRSGNIVKCIAAVSPEQEPVSEPKAAEPQIIVHREGVNISSVEFICVCGEKTEIRFDYVGE